MKGKVAPDKRDVSINTCEEGLDEMCKRDKENSVEVKIPLKVASQGTAED